MTRITENDDVADIFPDDMAQRFLLFCLFCCGSMGQKAVYIESAFEKKVPHCLLSVGEWGQKPNICYLFFLRR